MFTDENVHKDSTSIMDISNQIQQQHTRGTLILESQINTYIQTVIIKITNQS